MNLAKSWVFKIALIFIFVLGWSTQSYCRGMDGRFGLFVASGDAYSLGSVRLGFNNWEAGMMTNGGIYSAGIIRNVFFGHTYGGFGFSFILADNSNATVRGGFNTSIGYLYEWTSWFSFRAELMAIGQYQGVGYGGLLLGFQMNT